VKHYSSLQFFLILTLLTGLNPLVWNKAHAQGKRTETGTSYGFAASVGIQSFELTSNLISLNQQQIDQQGGSIGFIFSDDYWQVKINPIGFYNSSANSPTTVKLIESGAHFNLYPFKFLLNKPPRNLNLYFTAGVVRAKFKVDGTYLPEGWTSSCVYDYEAYSVGILSWNLAGGVGIQYQLPIDHGFIGFFAEMKKGISAGTSTDQDLFKNTSFNNLTMANVGFVIGINQ
jgi:hypothetical protein